MSMSGGSSETPRRGKALPSEHRQASEHATVHGDESITDAQCRPRTSPPTFSSAFAIPLEHGQPSTRLNLGRATAPRGRCLHQTPGFPIAVQSGHSGATARIPVGSWHLPGAWAARAGQRLPRPGWSIEDTEYPALRESEPLAVTWTGVRSGSALGVSNIEL